MINKAEVYLEEEEQESGRDRKTDNARQECKVYWEVMETVGC